MENEKIFWLYLHISSLVSDIGVVREADPYIPIYHTHKS